jgi:hypothetical protein
VIIPVYNYGIDYSLRLNAMHIADSIYSATNIGKRIAELEWGMLHVIDGQPCSLVWGKDVNGLYVDGFFDDGWFEWHHSPQQTKTHLQQAGLLNTFPPYVFISFQRANRSKGKSYQERIYISKNAMGNSGYCSFQAYIKEQLKHAKIK